MFTQILWALTIGPPLLFLWWVYRLDKQEREPKGLMIKLFLIGVASAIPIAFVEVFISGFNPFSEGELAYAFFEAFLVAALCEEVGKFICMKWLTWKSKHFNYRYDGIVYAVAVSLGFAAIENVVYVFDPDGSALVTAILRMILSIPAHLMFAISMGLFYGPMKWADNMGNKKAVSAFHTLSLLIPILLHGFYDFCLMAENRLLLLIFLGFVIIMDIFGIIITITSSKRDQLIVNPEQIEPPQPMYPPSPDFTPIQPISQDQPNGNS